MADLLYVFWSFSRVVLSNVCAKRTDACGCVTHCSTVCIGICFVGDDRRLQTLHGIPSMKHVSPLKPAGNRTPTHSPTPSVFNKSHTGSQGREHSHLQAASMQVIMSAPTAHCYVSHGAQASLISDGLLYALVQDLMLSKPSVCSDGQNRLGRTGTLQICSAAYMVKTPCDVQVHRCNCTLPSCVVVFTPGMVESWCAQLVTYATGRTATVHADWQECRGPAKHCGSRQVRLLAVIPAPAPAPVHCFNVESKFQLHELSTPTNVLCVGV